MEVSEVMRQLLERKKAIKKDIKSIEYSLLCRLIRSKLKEDLEDHNSRKRVAVAERKASLKKCRRKLPLYHPKTEEMGVELPNRYGRKL